MAKKPQYDPEEIRYPEQKIVESPLVPEMEKSYIEYAMSVIVGRALPDVRDGLKVRRTTQSLLPIVSRKSLLRSWHLMQQTRRMSSSTVKDASAVCTARAQWQPFAVSGVALRTPHMTSMSGLVCGACSL